MPVSHPPSTHHASLFRATSASALRFLLARPRARFGMLALSLSSVWLGCADTALRPIVEQPDASKPADEYDSDAAVESRVDECTEGDTEPCTCADRTSEGERDCSDGYFGICSGCPALDDTTKCVAGAYEGPFTGTYNGGIPGVIAFYPYEVKATMSLSLKDAIGEFATIGDGCMRSGDQGGGMAGWITGTVDCGTGELVGVMRAFYRMQDFLSGQWYKVFFKGKLTAVYHPDTQSFEAGVWSGEEPMGAINMAGGTGQWGGTLGKGSASPAGSLEECLGEPFPEEKFK